MVLYYSLAQHIRDNFENDAAMDAEQHTVVENIIYDIQTNIIIIDSGVLLAVGFFSYFLAGWTLRPIRETLNRQREFSADASHELRTPLAVMKTQSEVLLANKNARESDFRSLTVSNLEEVDRMSDLVEDLLELSRNDADRTAYQMRPLVVAEIAESVVKNMQMLARKKNIALSFNVSDKGTVMGDKNALGRMIMNVVKNAIQYTLADGKVAVTVEAGTNTVKVKVTDTGMGIADKDLPHIFERFYKADASRTSHEHGVGLGLSIVKAITEAHRGSVRAESQLNKGTTVVIELPRNK